MTNARVLSIQSLDRGLAVLALVQQHHGMMLRDVHEATAIPKASLLRILKTLVQRQCVSQTPEGAYVAVHPVQAAPPRPTGRQPQPKEIAAAARVVLRELAGRLPWPSDVGVRESTFIRVVASNRASFGAKWRRSVVGAEIDMLESALGRSYLAFCGPEEGRELLQAALARNPGRSRRQEAIQRQIDLAAARGFSSRDPFYAGPDSHEGDLLSAIAVPVLVHGAPVACMNCVWDTTRAQRSEVIEGCLAHLVRASTELAGELLSIH